MASNKLFNTKLLNNKSFDIGWGMQLSTPGLVTMASYGLLILLVMLPFDMNVRDPATGQTMKKKYNFGHRVLVALLLLFPFVLSIYSVNCMMVGKCTLWSWVVALLTLFWALIVTISAFSVGAVNHDDLMSS